MNVCVSVCVYNDVLSVIHTGIVCPDHSTVDHVVSLLLYLVGISSSQLLEMESEEISIVLQHWSSVYNVFTLPPFVPLFLFFSPPSPSFLPFLLTFSPTLLLSHPPSLPRSLPPYLPYPPLIPSLPPITQEEALSILGFTPPFNEIKFGPFTGNATVMRQVESHIISITVCVCVCVLYYACVCLYRWFKQLCNHRDVSGKAYYFYKPVGRGRTFGMKPEHALASLKEGLCDAHTAFIYHCWNHYFCPVGFEDVPKQCQDAYRYSSRSLIRTPLI